MEDIKNEIARHIAKRLTAARLKKNWTRDMLAKQSSVNVHTLKRFERTGQISFTRLIALCEALGMLDELTRGFKPRQRVSIDGWQVRENPIRQRGRRNSVTHHPNKEHLV